MSEWQPIETAPKDGEVFYAVKVVPVRWRNYKINGAKQMGRPGRFQEMNEWGVGANIDIGNFHSWTKNFPEPPKEDE